MKRWALLLAILLGMFGLTHAAQSPSPRVRWEYGRIFEGTAMIDGQNMPRVSWRATGTAVVESVDMSRFYAKLGGTGKRDDILDAFNLLGDDGWEYVGQHEVRQAFPHTEGTEYLFKRLK